MEDKILAVIDGNSLINRAYYAIQRPMITKDGIYTQGIYGFLSMLFKIEKDYKPTHMLVAFDRKEPTFRHIEFSDYKAGRKKMPVELAMEMPILKDVLHALGITTYEIAGYEADDILGTASAMAEAEGFKTYIFTGDRDSLQLATDKTFVILTKKGISEFKLYDDAAMMEEYGFDHVQFIDYKALRGDTSDNIPGIPGIGEKTAIKLIQQYGSLENIIKNADTVTPAKLKEKIEEGAMSAIMSKRLATIIRNVPMEIGIDDFKIEEIKRDELIDLYTKLEFKTYLSKLLTQSDTQEENSKPSAADINLEFPKVQVINSDEECGKALKDLLNSENICVFTDSDNNHTDIPKLGSLQVYDGKRCFVLESPALNQLVASAFDGVTIGIKGFHTGEFFYYLLSNGCDVSNIECSGDGAIARYVLSPSGKEPALEELILETFHENISKKQEQLSLFEEKDYSNISKKLVFTDALIRLQEKEIEEKALDFVYRNIELPLCKVLASMEAEGFKADKEALTAFGTELKARLLDLQKEIYELAGEEFNINSPQQLGILLFEKLGLPAGKKTSRGYSTNAEVLEKLAEDYPIAAKIIEYRNYAKLNSTYVEGLLPLIGVDGKIHPHFQQTVTATGRISCTQPNLQNIPVRQELGRKLRKVFTASSENRVLAGADYSQIELRVMASMSGDPALIESFNKGRDIHAETASKVFGVPLENVTPLQRSNAKAVNFGVIYGMSGFGLANELTISRKDAEKYIKDYFERFPAVKDYLDGSVLYAKKNGYTTTLFGRRRSIPEINAPAYMVRQLGERLAMNTPIQGTAADIIKLAMIKVYNALQKELPEAKLILQIHDELIIDTPKEKAEEVIKILKDCMESAAQLKVRLEVSDNIAYDWYELK